MMSNLLKLLKFLQLIIILPIMAFAAPPAEKEGGQGSGGSDRVEVLFLKAKVDANKIVEKIKKTEVQNLAIQDFSKEWLARDDNGRSNLAGLQLYLKTMKLVFQEGPCFEGKFERGATFDGRDPLNPKMIISRSLNRDTSPEQAVAMVIHEAGHLAGEANHIFLSQLGVELAQLATKITADDLTAWMTSVRFEDGDSRRWRSLCTADITIDDIYPGPQDRMFNARLRKEIISTITDAVQEKCQAKGVVCSDILVRSEPVRYYSGPYCNFYAYPRKITRD